MKTRDQRVLAALCLAGLVAALWFLVLAPKREQAAELRAQVEQAQMRRDVAITAAATAELARGNYRRDYSTVARLGKAVPVHADVPSLVYQLESAARAAKVDFRSVAIQDASPPVPGTAAAASASGIVPKPFSFTFEGGFFSLRKLLRSVDRFSRVRGQKVAISGRLLTLDGVTLTAGREGLPRVKAEISARAYVAAIPAALPAGKAAAAPAPAPAPAPSSTVPTAQVTP